MENLKSEATLWLKCGFYNPRNPDYLLLWLQLGLRGLFKPQIIRIESTLNPHFITRAGMALGSLTSFLWLFNRILKAVSAFPTYWILQSLHSSKYMMKLLLQVVFWNILNVLLVWLLLKCSVFITCLQQSVLEFEKHGEHFPLVNLLVVSSFLFFSIVFPPINCLRFLF